MAEKLMKLRQQMKEDVIAKDKNLKIGDKENDKTGTDIRRKGQKGLQNR